MKATQPSIIKRGAWAPFLAFTLLVSFWLAVPGFLWGAQPSSQELQVIYTRARVVEVISEYEVKDEFAPAQAMTSLEQELKVEILSDPYKGQIRNIVNNTGAGNPLLGLRAKVDDELILHTEIDRQGKLVNLYIQEIAREKQLFYLVGAFGILLVLFGGLRGLGALLTLVLIGVLVGKVLLPAILKGYNPLLVTILLSGIVTVVAMVAIGGFNRKSLAAIVGTIGGVTIAGILAYWAGTVTRIIGLDIEEATLLLNIPQKVQIDFTGLLFSSIIIGTLGAVMDVGISIASAIQEIQAADPTLSRKQLFKAGMNVGKDIMGMMSNTLILAYTSSSIPLLLLFMAHDIPMMRIINSDAIASEVVRSITGSIGLILAIPLTAACGAWWLGDRKNMHRKQKTRG